MVRGQRLNPYRMALRQAAVLLVMPVVVLTTTYALFSQQLTINGSASSVAYVSNNYTTATYTKTQTGTGPYTYSIAMTIKNNGATSITAWQVTFNLPPGMTGLTCPSSVVCTQNATTVTLKNGTGNGTIITLSTTSFSFSFTTTAASYTLQNVTISATYATTFQTVAGLTVTASLGTKSGGAYPLTMTITNNSGQSMSGWQVTIPTSKTCTAITGLPSGVTSVCGAGLITLTANTVTIASGASYGFSTPLPLISVSGTMTINGTVAVKGKA